MTTRVDAKKQPYGRYARIGTGEVSIHRVDDVRKVIEGKGLTEDNPGIANGLVT